MRATVWLAFYLTKAVANTTFVDKTHLLAARDVLCNSGGTAAAETYGPIGTWDNTYGPTSSKRAQNARFEHVTRT